MRSRNFLSLTSQRHNKVINVFAFERELVGFWKELDEEVIKHKSLDGIFSLHLLLASWIIKILKGLQSYTRKHVRDSDL